MRSFEELIAWQKARGLTKAIYMESRHGALTKDYGLASQIQRAAVSVMSNIAEGFERNRRTEFHQFLSVAKSSCAEVRSHLYVAYDADYLDKAKFGRLLNQAEEVSRIVGALRKTVAGQRDAVKKA
ncbi:four helix bundle protein [Nitrospira moscoviensis]|jgi:four helix bundle protein|uniref:S23 ribosomal protein n=1 Tax=Nitrospira moscoviensis TaxID=42253 RepID=A0A0K2GDE1_NITMO|nr:four helix bundle protein [Nitrospira moscoviensis]ALA58966.1 S23 ribosomal protein [Nitrospira moscoviensis]